MSEYEAMHRDKTEEPGLVSLDNTNPAPAANDAPHDGPGAIHAELNEEMPPRSAPLCEDRIRDELKKVIDPELFVNIVDLGLVYEVDLVPAEDGKVDVNVVMTLTSPMCPAGPQLIGNSQAVVEAIDGVAAVNVKVVMDPPWTQDRMTDDARDQLGIF